MPHTPGPWTWTEGWGSDDIVTGVLGPDHQMVIDPLECDGDPAFCCKPEDIRLIVQAPEMYALLKELEFCQQDFVGNAVCPICRMYSADAHPSGGHESDCRLAAVLKAVEGEENADET